MPLTIIFFFLITSFESELVDPSLISRSVLFAISHLSRTLLTILLDSGMCLNPPLNHHGISSLYCMTNITSTKLSNVRHTAL
ncbi:hypothetical protein BDQ17DRAFT_1376095, partial [Cyathus striatus]